MGKYCEYLECIDLVKACELIDRKGHIEIEGIPPVTELTINQRIRELLILSNMPPSESIASYEMRKLRDIQKNNKDITLERIKPRFTETNYKKAGLVFSESHNEETTIDRSDPTEKILDAILKNTLFYPSSELTRLSFIIYHYDLIIWFCRNGKTLEALACSEAIQAVAEAIGVWRGEYIERTTKATRSANARHAPTNKQKEEALKLWDETRQNYSSINGFSDTNCRKFDVKSRALARWISEHERAKRDD